MQCPNLNQYRKHLKENILSSISALLFTGKLCQDIKISSREDEIAVTSWRQKSPRDRNSIQTSNIANSTASNDGVNDTKWSPLSSLSLTFDTQEPLGFQEKLAILLFQELLLTIKRKDGQLSIELDGTTKRYLTNVFHFVFYIHAKVKCIFFLILQIWSRWTPRQLWINELIHYEKRLLSEPNNYRKNEDTLSR